MITNDPASASYTFSVSLDVGTQSTLLVDNTSDGFTTSGTWKTSAATDGYDGDSVHTNEVGAWAKWQPSLPVSGTYNVYAWWSAETPWGGTYDRDSAASYTVVYSGGHKDGDGGSGRLVGGSGSCLEVITSRRAPAAT